MRVANINILSAVNTGSATGSKIDVNQVVSASFTVVNGDATAAGTVKIQCSNEIVTNDDRAIFVPSAGSWVDIPNASSTIASGVGNAIVIPNMCFSYIRAVFTRSGGGSSTITVNMNALSC